MTMALLDVCVCVCVCAVFGVVISLDTWRDSLLCYFCMHACRRRFVDTASSSSSSVKREKKGGKSKGKDVRRGGYAKYKVLKQTFNKQRAVCVCSGSSLA